MNKYLISFIATVVIFGAIVGGYYYPEYPFISGATNNPVATVYNTAKVAQINFSPTLAATSTSILNSDATDRIVTDSFGDCNTVATSKTAYDGTGLAVLTFSAATTSTSAPATVTNANVVMSNTIATSTPDRYFASTTIGVLDYGRVWATGTYMTFWSNATNTAVCTVGVHYVGF